MFLNAQFILLVSDIQFTSPTDHSVLKQEIVDHVALWAVFDKEEQYV